MDPQDISVITSGKDFIGTSRVMVVSYDLLTKKREELLKKNYQLVILDESHMIKDVKSARTKAADPLARNAKVSFRSLNLKYIPVLNVRVIYLELNI